MRAIAFVGLLAACHHAATPVAVPAPPPAEVAGNPTPGASSPTVPPPVDPAPIVDGDVTDASVNGIHVIVKRIPGAEEVATQLYVRGGVRNWDGATAGIEQLAVTSSVHGGTIALDRDAFTRQLSSLGSTLDGYTTNDYSVMYAWSLTPAWDATFALLVDAFRRPALPPAIVEVQRAGQIAAIQSEQDNPDSKLSLLVHDTIFRGHPYEHRSIGTLANVKGFMVEQLRAHLAKLRESSRLVLVVVGDVEASHVVDATRRALGDLPRGGYTETPLSPIVQAKGASTLVEQALPTNYIEAVFAGPTWHEPEQLVIGMLAMDILHNREFEEVRTKRNLSYAPSAFFRLDSDVPMGGLYVTAVDPVATMKVMLAEAKRLRDEPIPDKELASGKSSLLTNLTMASEAPNDQATRLAQTQLRGGDWRLVRALPDRVRAITSAQVQTWAKRYVGHLHAFVIGDPKKVDTAALEAF